MEEKGMVEEGRQRHEYEYGEKRGAKERNGEGRRRMDATTIDFWFNVYVVFVLCCVSVTQTTTHVCIVLCYASLGYFPRET